MKTYYTLAEALGLLVIAGKSPRWDRENGVIVCGELIIDTLRDGTNRIVLKSLIEDFI